MSQVMISQEPDSEGYIATVPAAAVRQDQMTVITIGDRRPIILTRVGEVIHAVAATCPHAGADLTLGSLYRGRLECPDHGYRFDVATGRAVWPEDEVCRLKRYGVRIEAGVVKVLLMPGG
jgi:nitrite reductase/ring-hydroxylating ferredoxin subunit